MRTRTWLSWIVLTQVAVGFEPIARAQPSSSPVTPSPVSGHTLDDPSQITAADVLARTILLRDNLELIRRYMGRPAAPGPIVRATGASTDEALFNALNIRGRVGDLAFEQLRSQRTYGKPPLPERKVLSVDVFRLVDASLVKVLAVKAKLGIEEQPAEKLQAASTTPTELFNTLAETAGLVNQLVDRQVTGANAYIIVTILVHQAMNLHLAGTKRMMPDDPKFEPNKTPEDVLRELLVIFELIKRIAKDASLPVMTLARTEGVNREATIADIVDVGTMAAGELDRLQRKKGLSRKDVSPDAPLRKYPSHALQRAKLVRLILADIAGERASP